MRRTKEASIVVYEKQDGVKIVIGKTNDPLGAFELERHKRKPIKKQNASKFILR